MIVLGMNEALKRISSLQDEEIRKEKDRENPLYKGIDVGFYNRWLTLVGPYGQYVGSSAVGGGEEGSEFVIQQSSPAPNEFKVDVENVKTAETVSWVDKVVEIDRGK